MNPLIASKRNLNQTHLSFSPQTAKKQKVSQLNQQINEKIAQPVINVNHSQNPTTLSLRERFIKNSAKIPKKIPTPPVISKKEKQKFNDLDTLSTFKDENERTEIEYLLQLADSYLITKNFNQMASILSQLKPKLIDLNLENKIKFYHLSSDLKFYEGDYFEARSCLSNLLRLQLDQKEQKSILEKYILYTFCENESLTATAKDYLEEIKILESNESTWSLFEKAYLALEASVENPSKLSEAFDLCSKGLKFAPENPCLLRLEIKIDFFLKNYDLAKKKANNIINHSPKDKFALFYKGLCLLAEREYDNALNIFEFILKNYSSKEARLICYKISHLQGNYEKAKKELENLLSYHFIEEYLILYADLLCDTHHPEEALDYLYLVFKMFNKTSKNSNTKNKLISLCKKLALENKYDLAKVVKYSYICAMKCLKEKDFLNAKKRLNNIVKSSDNYVLALNARGVIFNKINQPDKANRCFSNCLEHYIKSLNSSGKEIELIQEVFLKKKMILRPFSFEDISTFIKFYDHLLLINAFSNFPKHSLFLAAENNGKGKLEDKNFEIVCLQAPDSVKMKGCVFFQYKKDENNFEIQLLHIAKKFKRKGYGGVLLSYAIQRALTLKFDSIILNSTTEGLPIYVSHGFKPTDIQQFNETLWEKMDVNQKIAFLDKQGFFGKLKLNLKRTGILINAQKLIQNNLSRPFNRTEISNDS